MCVIVVVVVGCRSYVTMLLPKERSGSVASLRTFRVLRALKTVAVVPGQPCNAVITIAIRLRYYYD